MPIRKRIVSFFKRIVERKIDPELHDPTHFKFNTVARGLQDAHGYSKKVAKAEAKLIFKKRDTVKDLIDKGLSEKDAIKIAKKILKVESVKISDIDKNILTYAKT